MKLELNGRGTAITTHSITTNIPETEALSNIKRELGVIVNFYNQTKSKTPLPFTESEKAQFFSFIINDSNFADQDFANKFSCGFWLPQFLQAGLKAFAENTEMIAKISQVENDPLLQFLFWVDITTTKNQQSKVKGETKQNIWEQIDWENLTNVQIAQIYNYSQQYVSTQRGIYAPNTTRPIIPKEISTAFLKNADLERSDDDLANEFGVSQRDIRELRRRKEEWQSIKTEREARKKGKIDQIVKLGENVGIKTTLP